jgi:hypothetical protein
MVDPTQPYKPPDKTAPLDKTLPYGKTMPIETPPSDLPTSSDRLVAATQILQQLGPHAPPVAETKTDIRAIDFLRAADEIVRPFGFEIVRLIGQGGMGAVFEGRDRKLDRGVAIKFILPERLEMFEGMAALLESEARALASINHENAVQIYAIHRQGNNLFIVMELVRGMSLASYVNNRGPLPEAQVLRLTIQAARALAALHQQGIIHRDIKPENILLTEKGQAKLSDFGLALARRGKAASGIASSAAGTPLYMSPEVFEGETPSVRSDIYSLGMTVRFMLTGKRPALGDSLDEIRRAVIHGRLPGLRTERSDVSADAELLVAMALKRSADQRYQTAEALAAACEKALLRLGVVREKPALPPARVLLRSGSRMMAFIAALALIAGVIGWWAHGVVQSGSRLVRMATQQAGIAISNRALEWAGDKKASELVPAEVAAALRDEQKLVRVIGVVSATGGLDPRRRQFVLQDETGGVLVDDGGDFGVITKDLAIGDKVEVVGVVQPLEGLRVLEVADYIDRKGPGRPPKAVPLSLEQIGPEWAGCRVSLKNVRWAEQQPQDAKRARASDGQGHEIELRAGANASMLANRSSQRFDLVAIVFVTEPPGGKPGHVGEVFLLPLEIQPAK